MNKVYIDVPVVAYQTFLLSIFIKDKNGNYKQIDDDMSELRGKYPYSHENKHVK